MIITAPGRKIKVGFPGLIKMSIRNPLLPPESEDLIMDPAGNQHLIQRNSIKLVAWTISATVYWHMDYYHTYKLPNNQFT